MNYCCQKEKEELKDVNENLLQISCGAQSKSDKNLQENILKKQVHTRLILSLCVIE